MDSIHTNGPNYGGVVGDWELDLALTLDGEHRAEFIRVLEWYARHPDLCHDGTGRPFTRDEWLDFITYVHGADVLNDESS